MRSARLAAATLVVGAATSAFLALSQSAPASAADPAATISFASPSAPGTVFRQTPLELQGEASRAGGFVDSVTIAVTWSDTTKGRPPGPHPPSSVTVTPTVPAASVPWSFQPSTPYNGTYTVTVTATTDSGAGTFQTQSSSSSTFVADLPPAVPAHVVATRDAAHRVTDLSWAANPEPDLLGYWIIRGGPAATDSGNVVGGVDAPQTSFTDDQVATEPPGSYRYEVVAIRMSATGNSLDVSTPSQVVVSTFTTPANAVAPAPTTSAPPTTRPATVTTTGGAPAAAATSGGTVATSRTTLPTPPVVIPTATNSLPSYQALLNQAKRTTVTTAPPDPGFASNLPYQHVTHKVITVPVASPQATLGAPDQPAGRTRTTLELIAGALILAVLAMFALVLKRSADQAAVLEALAPAGAPDPAPGAADLPEAADPMLEQPAFPRRRRGPLGGLRERSARVAAALAAGTEPAPAIVTAALFVPEAGGRVPDPRPGSDEPDEMPDVDEGLDDDLWPAAAGRGAALPLTYPLVDLTVPEWVDLVDDVDTVEALPASLLFVLGQSALDDVSEPVEELPQPALAGAAAADPGPARPLASPWRS